MAFDGGFTVSNIFFPFPCTIDQTPPPSINTNLSLPFPYPLYIPPSTPKSPKDPKTTPIYHHKRRKKKERGIFHKKLPRLLPFNVPDNTKPFSA